MDENMMIVGSMTIAGTMTGGKIEKDEVVEMNLMTGVRTYGM
ncbi:MAG TPA: hypothetical protein VHT73_18615 [Thermodesulfobacteriota bacterium]|nr:hypothetical protein [Thermodesulfobacteriota bacterium]